MKHLKKLLFAVIVLMTLSSQAQDSNNPWALSFGVNAIDYRTSAGGGNNWLDQHFSQLFNVSDNWNIIPSVSYIGVARSVGNNLSVGLQGSINKIDKFVVFDPSHPDHNSSGYAVVNPGDLMYYGIDANVKYSFKTLIKSKIIDPSLRLGGGYTFTGLNSYGTVNPGAGLTFWFNDNVGFALETTYKIGFGDRQQFANGSIVPDHASHFQHTAGIVFQFGGKDTDKDGIYDKDDACPEVAGLKQYNGCPDTDGDGVADKDDACPEVAGLVSFKGCPDTDKDGVADKDDKCPTVAGPASNGGCPVLDADNDGVADKEDDCPTVVGPISNKGCPEVTVEVIEKLKIQARSVFFNSGKATFKTGDAATVTSLDAMKEILKNYPNAKFSIEGHTDSDGSDKLNQKLSEDRANAVRNVLIENGIKPENLTAVGYGESKPIASNKTKAGKAQNRRTEVRHVGSIYEGKL